MARAERDGVRAGTRRLPWRRRQSAATGGIARVDRRTKDLIPRLKPGEIAVIDHEDLDRVSAEGLVERHPAAVVNARASITGRYPNSGPSVLARAGIPLIDRAGPDVLSDVREGDVLVIRGSEVFHDGELVAHGILLEGAELE